MKKLLVFLMMGMVCISAFMTGNGGVTSAQDPNAVPEGIDVQTRGPVHEAFAAPQSLDPRPEPIVPKQPPEPVPEIPPDQKPDGNNVVWISGYWAWVDETADFLWVSGFWRDIPPGKRWVPGNWMPVDNGWQWTSGFWADQADTQVNYAPPPPPTLENGPPTAAPADDQFYSPGCWVYVERQYRWRPGFWLTYRPNWAYVPAHYVWTPAGCLFVEGFWDYELTRRGLLFCPIRFTANLWTRPGWSFTPQFIVYPDVLVSALFVRIDYHRYCFGDYFGAGYLKHGFVPWMDYRLHGKIPEPLFHQFAWQNRNVPNWERDMRKLYDDRRLGLAPRPPHTLGQQREYLSDLAAHKMIKVGEKNFAIQDVKAAEGRLTMVNTLAKVDRMTIPLKALTPAAHAEVMKTVAHYAEVKTERKNAETRIVNGTPPARPSDIHQVGKLPAAPAHLQPARPAAAPAPPVAPKHVERVVPMYEPPRAVHASPKPVHIEKR